MRTPDFEGNLKKVLKKQKPDRATLFEFLISEEAEVALSGYQLKEDTPEEHIKRKILAFYHAGYDFVPFLPGNLWFTKNPHKTAQTYSLNDGGVITDRESFEKYPWPAMETIHYRTLEIAQKFLPDGMKIMAYCPDGILENVIGLCGYENLCYLLADDRELVKDIFTEVGTRIDIPVSLPFRAGRTLPTALAAPVELGMMFSRMPRPPRQSFLEGSSPVFWVAVAAWTVVIRPRLMPKLSLSTLAIGARQLVVQLALEMMSWPA